MSLVIEKYIMCDGERCSDDGHTKNTVDDMGNSIKNMRRNLKDEGWTNKGGLDYCPECFEKLKKIR